MGALGRNATVLAMARCDGRITNVGWQRTWSASRERIAHPGAEPTEMHWEAAKTSEGAASALPAAQPKAAIPLPARPGPTVYRMCGSVHAARMRTDRNPPIPADKLSRY